MSFSRIKIE